MIGALGLAFMGTPRVNVCALRFWMKGRKGAEPGPAGLLSNTFCRSLTLFAGASGADVEVSLELPDLGLLWSKWPWLWAVVRGRGPEAE